MNFKYFFVVKKPCCVNIFEMDQIDETVNQAVVSNSAFTSVTQIQIQKH